MKYFGGICMQGQSILTLKVATMSKQILKQVMLLEIVAGKQGKVSAAVCWKD